MAKIKEKFHPSHNHGCTWLLAYLQDIRLMPEKTGFMMVREVTLGRWTTYLQDIRPVSEKPVCDGEVGDLGHAIQLPTGYLSCVRKNRFGDGEGGE